MGDRPRVIPRTDKATPGTIEYAGTVEEMRVTIWGVVDHAAFYDTEESER